MTRTYSHNLIRALLGLNSLLWIGKILLYIYSDGKLPLPAVLKLFANVEYVYMPLLTVHVVCVTVNLVSKDLRSWLGELEITFGVLIAFWVIVSSFEVVSLKPENIVCGVLAILVYVKHRPKEVRDPRTPTPAGDIS